MFEYSKLKGRIREVCNSDTNFASKMELNRSTVSSKLNNRSEFTQDEIKRACKILNIPPEKIGEYFFRESVAK